MKYKSFRIVNFKGIKDTTVELSGHGGASVFCFVGLNEGGKTTILEAIHSFSPDVPTTQIVDGGSTGVPIEERVPRHQISNFTGDIVVTARLSVTIADKSNISKTLKEDHNITLNKEDFPEEVTFESRQQFKGGDFQEDLFALLTDIKVKTGSERKWRSYKNEAERLAIRDTVYSLTPDIAYFPTFVYDFPKSIYITERGGKIDAFYRRMFQDILDYDGKGHSIVDDIVRRVRGKNMAVSWQDFLALWTGHDDRHKIQHVMDRAGAAVTRVVFERWNKIFREDAKGKEVLISFDPVEGAKRGPNGAVVKTMEHDLSIKFQIRDGTRRFDVNDRSLGFRWFFAFLMFTQFRVARGGARPLLFLFDEPASNLHAAAQQKLIESFPEIVKGEHTLAYTTHSHYMIEPKWLEQTFIVTNRSDSPLTSVLDATSLEDESLDIKVTPYRSFVNNNPNKTSYFQPILDRLEVVPSRFDVKKSSIIMEGKSDYYVLRYAARLLNKNDLPLLPGLGAGTLGALIALHIGWGLKMLFVLDGDKQGKMERDRYVSEFGLRPDRIVTINELATNVSEIEDLLDQQALNLISTEMKLAGKPTKKQIASFFQERLASDSISSLGTGFDRLATIILDALSERLDKEVT